MLGWKSVAVDGCWPLDVWAFEVDVALPFATAPLLLKMKLLIEPSMFWVKAG